MKTIYNTLISKFNELNKINDEINLIEWNKEDGPAFSSVEEMKKFENRVINGELDYILGEAIYEDIKDNIIYDFKHTINNYFFYIYTFKSDDEYITYLSIKDLTTNEILNHLYGNKTKNQNSAKDYFDNLKNDISNNTIEYIFNNILVDIEKNIEILKNKYTELTNKS